MLNSLSNGEKSTGKVEFLFSESTNSLNQSNFEENPKVFFGSLFDGRLGILGSKSAFFVDTLSNLHHLDGFKVFEKGSFTFGDFESAQQISGNLPFVGRSSELEILQKTIATFTNVEINGASGIGKTRLLNHFLATRSTALKTLFSDGLAWPILFQEDSIQDILQSIFRCLFESNFLYKPSPAAVSQYFHRKKILVILDQRKRKLTSAEVEELSETLPFCTFLYISEEVSGFSRTVSIPLKGLTLEQSMTLVEHLLQYPLSSMERQSVQELCLLLAGNPRDIIQNIGLVKNRTQTLLQACRRIKLAQSNPEYSLRPLVDDESGLQENIISTLAIFTDYGLTEKQLSFILGSSTLQPTLDKLVDKSYIQPVDFTASARANLLLKEDVRYILSPNIAKTLREANATLELQASLSYFLGQDWQRKIESPGFSEQDISPLVGLFRQSLSQPDSDLVAMGGEILATACLRLGLWGMRKEVLHRVLNVTQPAPKRIEILGTLGLQELCLTNYKASCQYFNQARDLCGNSGTSSYLNWIDRYAGIALDRSRQEVDNVIDNQLNHSESKFLPLQKPLQKIGELSPSKLKFKDTSKADQNSTVLSPFLRRLILMISTVSVAGGLAWFAVSQLYRGSSLLLSRPAAIQKTFGLGEFSRLSSNYKDKFANSTKGPDVESLAITPESSNLAIENDLMADQNSPFYQGTISAVASGVANQPSLPQKPSIALLSTPAVSTPQVVYKAPRTEILPQSVLTTSSSRNTGSRTSLESSDNSQLQNPQPQGSRAQNPQPQNPPPQSSLTQTPRPPSQSNQAQGSRPQNPQPQISTETESPPDTLSNSMCEFLAEEISLSEQSSVGSQEMYRLLMAQGNCPN